MDAVYYSSSETLMKQQILTDKTARSVFKDVYAKALKRYNLKQIVNCENQTFKSGNCHVFHAHNYSLILIHHITTTGKMN